MTLLFLCEKTFRKRPCHHDAHPPVQTPKDNSQTSSMGAQLYFPRVLISQKRVIMHTEYIKPPLNLL